MTTGLANAFGPFERVWLNTAHQGPLPRVAAQAARLAVAEKCDPRRMAEDSFFAGPHRLRTSLGRLVGADPERRGLQRARRCGQGADPHPRVAATKATGRPTPGSRLRPRLRIAPHVHNTTDDIDRLLAARTS